MRSPAVYAPFHPRCAPVPTAQTLAALATAISAVNITGGFVVTKKMLDLFKRPDDPPEYYEYYAVPVAAFVGGYALTSLGGYKETSSIMATASALCCIGGIAGLANQSTARLGNVSGMAGVALGLSSCIGSVEWPAATYVQLAGCLGGGGALGYAIGQKVSPTSLPQTVAAFHSLVGLAAVFTGVADYLENALHHPAALDGLHMGSIGLATMIGGVTATGSLIAFGKLNENLSSAALALPGAAAARPASRTLRHSRRRAAPCQLPPHAHSPLRPSSPRSRPDEHGGRGGDVRLLRPLRMQLGPRHQRGCPRRRRVAVDSRRPRAAPWAWSVGWRRWDYSRATEPRGA